MKTNHFEDYLMDIHGQQYTGLDDDMPDDYNEWIMAQDPNDIIAWAEKWHASVIQIICQYTQLQQKKNI